MTPKRLVELEEEDYGEETDSETEALQEAFAKGILKPGLNIPYVEKKYVNNVEDMSKILSEFQQDLDWSERLDLINKRAPLPPELAAQMSEELKRDRSFAYNELKHESIFYRQAQDAVLKGIPMLHKVQIQTNRPNDYFAEMSKSDEHMQKVKAELIRKKAITDRIEKVRTVRAQKKMQKMLNNQSKLEKQEAKKKFSEEVKKYRKGQKKDLDFLESKPQKKGQAISNQSQLKRHYKNSKFGFGGKKRGLKRNTRDSTNDLNSEGNKFKKGSKPIQRGKGKGNKGKAVRPGKNRRKLMKGKTK